MNIQLPSRCGRIAAPADQHTNLPSLSLPIVNRLFPFHRPNACTYWLAPPERRVTRARSQEARIEQTRPGPVGRKRIERQEPPIAFAHHGYGDHPAGSAFNVPEFVPGREIVMGGSDTLCAGCKMIDLPVVNDPRGDLTFVEGGRHVPFEIARVYYLYNVPVQAERGGHAHLELRQVLFALSGSFRVKLDDGTEKVEIWLNNPRKGLLIERLVWREMDCFSQGAVCMVLASTPYQEADYLRDYDDFKKTARTVRR